MDNTSKVLLAVAAGAAAGGWTGSIQTLTNEFNGASWTDVSAALGTGSYEHGACGTQTAALSRVGGYNDSSMFATCEEYNGASHTSSGVGSLSASTYSAQTCGTQTSAINGAGYVSAVVTTCHTYDGSTWSSSAVVSTARRSAGIFGASDSDANLNAGYGASADLDSTELWNGSSWASGDTLTTARRGGSSSGSSSGTGLTAGKADNSNSTEEFTETVTAQTITDS